MSELWTPSDDQLMADPVAQRMIEVPVVPPDFADAGIILSELDDDALEAQAACALAEDEGDDADLEGEDGDVNDEPDDDDDEDDEPVPDDV